MEPVAQAVALWRAVGPGDGDRAHDLADLAFATEQVAASAHPRPDVGRVAVELEGAGIDGWPLRPRDRRLRRDDVEDVHPPRRPVDDLEAAVAADGDVVLDDRVDMDAEVVERAHRSDGISLGFGRARSGAWRRGAPKGIRTPDLHLERVAS